MTNTERRLESIEAILYGVFADSAISRANDAAMRSVLQTLCGVLQVNSLDGVPVRQWYEQRLKQELEKEMIGVEDLDPGVAARLQEKIDGALKLSTW